jgi:elongation factor P
VGRSSQAGAGFYAGYLTQLVSVDRPAGWSASHRQQSVKPATGKVGGWCLPRLSCARRAASIFHLEETQQLMASTNELKNGMVLNIDGQLWTVVEFQHVKPGKGGAFVRTTLKNVLSGKVVDRTFNAGTKVETATVDKRTMTFLYKEGEDFVFMDGDTYEQMHIPAAVVGEGASYLLDNAEVGVAVHEGLPLFIELPTSVELVITYTEPGLQGDRATGGTKPATVETGAEVQVPLFVTTGEKIKIDTRDGRYLGRINS